jgi:ankyrin repeat protein
MYVHIDKRRRRDVFLMIRFQTPLHDAARNRKGDIVEILLRNGANINEKAVKNISVEETDDFEKEQGEREREGEGGR